MSMDNLGAPDSGGEADSLVDERAEQLAQRILDGMVLAGDKADSNVGGAGMRSPSDTAIREGESRYLGRAGLILRAKLAMAKMLGATDWVNRLEYALKIVNEELEKRNKKRK